MACWEKKRLKVLHLVKTSVGAIWAFRQMRELAKLGFEVHVVLPSGGPLITQYISAGIIVHFLDTDFPIRAPLRLPRILSCIRNLVRQVEPQVIHSHFVGTTLSMRLALGKRHEVPRIFQIPGPLHLEHSIFRKTEIATAGPSDYWIGSCNWTCDRYVDIGVPKDRVFLSYYGTDLENFYSQKKGKLREELGVDASVKLVGMVAFMYPTKRYLGQTRGLKGHEDLIDAISVCLEKDHRIKGVFIGGAWNGRVSYEKSIRNYGLKRCGKRAIFLGTRNNVAELYADFDMAVHPSHSENVGGAVESLLSNCPTVVTAVGGLPDLVKDGETGWVVPPRRPDLLAKAIMEVINNPEEAAARARRGHDRACAMFNVKKTAQQVKNIYQQIICKQHKSFVEKTVYPIE
jgi:glycosyltransferase involved in cell wall biosynthesis